MAFKSRLKEKIYSTLSIDFFSIIPSSKITFLKKDKFSTKLGIFSSWVVIALTMVTFFNFGSNMIKHENPNFFLSQIVTPDPENFELHPENFFFAFGLQNLKNKSQHFIDETIYTVQVIKRTKIEGNIMLQYLNTSTCDADKVPDINDLKDYFIRNNVGKLYCIQNYSDIVPELKSTWDGTFYKNVLVNVLACKNDSNKNDCQSPETIKNTLNSANFAMYMTNLAVDSNNYENPIAYYGKQIYTPISSTTLTYIELLFAHLEFLTDDGFLFENIKETKTVNFVSSRQILTFNNETIMQLDLKLDKIKTTYKRKYDTIQEVAANIGGIIQAIMIVMNFIVPSLANLDFRQTLANTLFYFDNNDYHVKFSKGTNMNRSKMKIVSTQIKFKEKVREIKNGFPRNGILPKKKLEIEKLEKNVHITYWEYLFSCLKTDQTQKKIQLINKGLDMVDNTLDISFIMNKLIELDKLKLLLLNKSQLSLFQIIPKPVISLTKPRKQTSLHHDFSNLLNDELNDDKLNASRTRTNFHKIKEKEKKTSIDEKLIDLISELEKNGHFNLQVNGTIKKYNLIIFILI